MNYKLVVDLKLQLSTIMKVMNIVFVSVFIMELVSAETTTLAPGPSRSCWKCPHGIIPGQDCLNNATNFGESVECRGDTDGVFNGCESIVVGTRDDGVSPTIKYNRRCAHEFGIGICQLKDIEIQGEGFFPAKICRCNTDNCNTSIEEP